MTPPLNRPMITFSIMLATTMQTLDSTIANVALPHMQGALSASQDRFGRKIMLIRPPERSKIGDMDAHAVVD